MCVNAQSRALDFIITLGYYFSALVASASWRRRGMLKTRFYHSRFSPLAIQQLALASGNQSSQPRPVCCDACWNILGYLLLYREKFFRRECSLTNIERRFECFILYKYIIYVRKCLCVMCQTVPNGEVTHVMQHCIYYDVFGALVVSNECLNLTPNPRIVLPEQSHLIVELRHWGVRKKPSHMVLVLAQAHRPQCIP